MADVKVMEVRVVRGFSSSGLTCVVMKVTTNGRWPPKHRMELGRKISFRECSRGPSLSLRQSSYHTCLVVIVRNGMEVLDPCIQYLR